MSDQLLFAVIGLAFFLILIYFIIKGAVSSAIRENNKDLVRFLRLANQLQIEQMKKDGFTKEQIQHEIDKIFMPSKI